MISSILEFIMAAINRQKLLTKEKLKTAFTIFDKNGDGFIFSFKF